MRALENPADGTGALSVCSQRRHDASTHRIPSRSLLGSRRTVDRMRRCGRAVDAANCHCCAALGLRVVGRQGCRLGSASRHGLRRVPRTRARTRLDAACQPKLQDPPCRRRRERCMRTHPATYRLPSMRRPSRVAVLQQRCPLPGAFRPSRQRAGSRSTRLRRDRRLARHRQRRRVADHDLGIRFGNDTLEIKRISTHGDDGRTSPRMGVHRCEIRFTT